MGRENLIERKQHRVAQPLQRIARNAAQASVWAMEQDGKQAATPKRH
jgi:hypothetical protein